MNGASQDESLMPVVLAVDVEPEPGGGTWRDPRPWRGFERWLEIMPQLRERLERLTGAPVHFSWFIRCDPQIADVYGDAAWAAGHYAAGLERLRAAGDEFAIHPHAWRWDDDARHWVHDNADPAWVEYVLESGFERFAAAFGQPVRAHRFGSRFLTAAIVRWLAAHGVRVDTTVEPGTPALKTLDASAAFTGTIPEQRDVPLVPYRPHPDDPFRPAATDSAAPDQGLWMLPHSAFDPQSLIPAWRRVARRVRFFGQPRYRPAQMWTPQEATGFWNLAIGAAQELPRPYLLLALRSSALFDAEPARHTMAKLEALQRHPLVPRMRFVTSAEALDAVVGTASARS
jgi:hypothetical protein